MKLLPFLYLALLLPLCAMEENNPLKEKVMHQQLCIDAWEKVTQTNEFKLCAALVKFQRKPSDPAFQQALKNLYEKDEFEKYLAVKTPPFGECWPPLESEAEKKT